MVMVPTVGYSSFTPYANPYNVFLQNFTAGSPIVSVNGIEGANAYPTQPNQKYALFDTGEDAFYLKSTDASNFPKIEKYYFYKAEPVPESSNNYVTMEEFQKFKEELLSGKQHIRSAAKSGKHREFKRDDKSVQKRTESPSSAAADGDAAPTV